MAVGSNTGSILTHLSACLHGRWLWRWVDGPEPPAPNDNVRCSGWHRPHPSSLVRWGNDLPLQGCEDWRLMHGDRNRMPGSGRDRSGATLPEPVQGLGSLGGQAVPHLVYYLYPSLRARRVLPKGQSTDERQVCFTAEVPNSTQTPSHRLSTTKPWAPNSVASAASTYCACAWNHFQLLGAIWWCLKCSLLRPLPSWRLGPVCMKTPGPVYSPSRFTKLWAQGQWSEGGWWGGEGGILPGRGPAGSWLTPH